MMLRTAFLSASTLALVATLSSPVFAEDARTGTGAHYRAKLLLGSKVHIRGDHTVGTVDDIVLSSEGVVDYLVVANEGKLVTVPWDAVKYNRERRMATVDITQEQYQKIPTFTSDRYPDFYTPTYRNQVFKYYGILPGRERRLERRERRP